LCEKCLGFRAFHLRQVRWATIGAAKAKAKGAEHGNDKRGSTAPCGTTTCNTSLVAVEAVT
jgi:hypothetical protein